MIFVRALALWLCSLAPFAIATFASLGSTVVLNGIVYYIPSTPVGVLQVDLHKIGAAAVADLMPFTMVVTSSLTFSVDDLQAIIANYTASDDVFQEGFLQGTSISEYISLTLILPHYGPMITPTCLR